MPSAETHVDGLVERAGRGTLWAMLGFGGGQALRFAGNLVLTRLLLPEAFGLMVLVNTFLMGLALFSDIGINTSIIQNKRGEERAFLDTAWTLSVARGALIALCASACAFPFALFYQEPALSGLIPAASLSVFFQCASSVRLITANRELRLRALVLVELASQAIGLVVSVALAFAWTSVWALIVGTVLGAAARMVLSFVAFDGPRERFLWDRHAAAEIVKLGKWIFLSTAAMFLANNVDRFVFGKIAALDVLGLYNQATQLASVPAAALSHLSSNIVFPLFAAMLARGVNMTTVFARTRFPLLVLGGWAVAGLIVGGPALVTVLYPEVYAPAGRMLQLLAAVSWFGLVLEGTNGAMLLAQGRVSWVAAGSLVKVALLGPCMLAGWHLGGSMFAPSEAGATLGAHARAAGAAIQLAPFYGALVGLVVAESAKYAVSSFAIGLVGMHGRARDAALTLVVAASATVGILLVGFATRALSPWTETLATHVPITHARVDGIVAGLLAAVVVTALWAPLLRAALRVWRTRSEVTPSVSS